MIYRLVEMYQFGHQLVMYTYIQNNVKKDDLYEKERPNFSYLLEC